MSRVLPTPERARRADRILRLGRGLISRGSAAPSGFTAININVDGMTAAQAPSEGEAPSTHPSALVTASMGDGGNATLGGGLNRCLDFAQDQDPPTAWAWDLQDYGNGENAPVEGFRIQLYMCAAAVTSDYKYMEIDAAIGNGKDLHWRRDESSDDGISIKYDNSAANLILGSQSIVDNAYGLPSTETFTKTDSGPWNKLRLEFNGSARTVQVTNKDLKTATERQTTAMSLPAEGPFPYPDFRWFTFATYIGTGGSSTRLHSVWIGKLTDSWPAELSYTP